MRNKIFCCCSGHVFGANTSESLQTFADASYGNQFLNGSYDNADNNICPPTVNEPITHVLGSLSEDKTFTTNDGRVLEPSTVLTSEGAYSTFNVMVSPDGTLVHSATDNSMATSEGYVYLNANNALGISPSSSVVPNTNVATIKNTGLASHAAVTMATKTASNIVMAPYTTIALTTNPGSTVVQAPNTTIAMTTNHFSGGTVLSQNTVIPSPVKTSNVILIPKVSAGKDSHQIVTLNNETLQAYIKGNKQLFSSPQKFTYSAGSKLKTGVNQVHASPTNQQSTSNDTYTGNVQQQSTSPKLTSLLKGSLADQILMQTQTNVLPVTVRPTTQDGQANNQAVVCNNIKDNLLKIVHNSQPQLVSTYDGKSVVVQFDKSKFGVKNQNTAPSGQHVNAVQGQYVTTLTTNNAGSLTKNVIKGNSNILCGSSSQNILAAISSGMKLSQSNNATSSNPHVTYFITTSTPSNNPVMTSGICNKDTPKRGRGRGSRGRGRGRIVKGSSVGRSQYILVQKGEIQTLPSKVIPDLNIQHVQNNSSGALSMTQNVSNSQTTTNTDLIDLITSHSKSSDCATTTNTVSQQLNGNSVQSQESEKCINKKFVRCKDGGELISGTTYLVSGPNGLQQKMLFNGENFVEPTTELSCKYLFLFMHSSQYCRGRGVVAVIIW